MGRGRKPSKQRKGYFYEPEEQAVVDYIIENDVNKKNQLFIKFLYPAFTTMIESIMRRYKLSVPDEEFEQTFRDTMSYLMSKIEHFRPIIFEYEEIEQIPENVVPQMIDISEKKLFFKNADNTSPKYIIVNDDDNIIVYELKEKHYKAFSYCQTVCKNYLMYKGIQYAKSLQRETPYDDSNEIFDNNMRYSTADRESYLLAESLIKKTEKEIEQMLKDKEKNNLNEDEVKVGYALCELLNNWEEHAISEGSNKLQKSKVLYFLREETMMTTNAIRKNMKPFKNVYYLLKKKELE